MGEGADFWGEMLKVIGGEVEVSELGEGADFWGELTEAEAAEVETAGVCGSSGFDAFFCFCMGAGFCLVHVSLAFFVGV